MELLEDDNSVKAISPIEEIAAYETLWQEQKATFKTISDLFKSSPGSKPSDFVSVERYQKNIQSIISALRDLRDNNMYKPNLLINGTIGYPDRLRHAREPVELLYYTGNLNLLYSRSVAIVGTRNPTVEGKKRTEKLVRLLVKDGFTIVSGLAQGIDTIAHHTALKSGGDTIGVIGTPLNRYYPKQNKELQEYIGKYHLLVSQVPFLRYDMQDYRSNRLFFPERNKTMSAITEATVIIEAGETSGTLIQARAAIQQGRKLFILDSCFRNKNITWPDYYHKRGAIRVENYEDIINALNNDPV